MVISKLCQRWIVRRWIVRQWIVWFLPALFVPIAAAQEYTVTALGALSGFTSSYADDNNDSGLVTGCTDNSVYPTVPCTTNIPADAFLWSGANGMQNLGSLPGDDMSIGYVVNNSGAVVGFSGDSKTGGGHAFYWTQSGGMVDLGTLIGSNGYSIGEAITSSGIIVGASTVTNGDVHAVLWTMRDGTYHIEDEGHLPKAPYTYPSDINEKQQVVGTAYFNEKGTKYQAFLWSKAAGWKDLGTLAGGTNSYAVWMNNSGVSVGDSTSTEYPNGVVVYWDASGTIHSIGTLPGGTSSAPGFINDSGEIFGDSTVTGGADHAFIWTESKGMRDLNNMIPKNSGWVLHHASSINTSGQIVGYGTYNGENQAFLLTPKT